MPRKNAKRSMLRVQRDTSKAPRGRESAPIPPAQRPRAPGAQAQAPSQTLARGTQAQAIALLLEGVPRVVRSVRVLIVGASQRGKTTFAKDFCFALGGARCAMVVFDQKFPDLIQYRGSIASSVGQLRNELVMIAPTVICRAPLTCEDAATAVKDMAECGDRATLLIDEITPALKVNTATGEPVERVWSGPSLVWMCLQGGGLGASLVQLCQMPRMVPGSLVDNATAYVFFGTGGRSLAYSVDDLRIVPREAKDVVAGLAVGECCIFFPDRDWNRTVYGPQ